jgi:hypothetical protein
MNSFLLGVNRRVGFSVNAPIAELERSPLFFAFTLLRWRRANG